MNYFGMFFCFMIPGIIIGMMLASGFRSAAERRGRRNRRRV